MVLWIPARSFSFRLRGFHSLWREFPFASPLITVRSSGPNPGVHALRFGLFRFRSPLLSKSHVVFSSSGYLDVSVHRVPFVWLWIYHTMTEVCSAGFPHSDICGSGLICSSPQLFAAYHVFRRLSVPRHPPCALVCLTCYAFFRKLSSPSVGNRLLERVHISMNILLYFYSFKLLLTLVCLVSIHSS